VVIVPRLLMVSHPQVLQLVGATQAELWVQLLVWAALPVWVQWTLMAPLVHQVIPQQVRRVQQA
jgi:hypothetical protein